MDCIFPKKRPSNPLPSGSLKSDKFLQSGMNIQCSDCDPIVTTIKSINVVRRSDGTFWRIVECADCGKVFHHESAIEAVAFKNMRGGASS